MSSMRVFGLGRYFTFWAFAYVALSLSLSPSLVRTDVLAPMAVAWFLFFGNLALLAVSILVWRRSFDASFAAASVALHGLPLLVLLARRRPLACWRPAVRALALLWFAYLAAVGGPSRVRDTYRRMPTRWSELYLARG